MEIAKTTLGYESEQRELQTVVEAQRKRLRDAQQALAEKQARQQCIVARYRPDALLEQLSVAVKNVRKRDDEVATQFVHGDINVVQFLSTYLPRRNLYQNVPRGRECISTKRRSKRERARTNKLIDTM
ncbi:unnamed protein product [Peronospora destructor]|uniref:VPS37 C-terminal domain-containing protein n=1 Tax=Peronospora destructor TaxID=86335 RepID=A0AAV0TV03_9STRA|nr:unnamed protein product [Peronospora destructor]